MKSTMLRRIQKVPRLIAPIFLAKIFGSIKRIPDWMSCAIVSIVVGELLVHFCQSKLRGLLDESLLWSWTEQYFLW
jgi:hypothetical protein